MSSIRRVLTFLSRLNALVEPTEEGKQEYVAAQRGVAARGAPLRQRLVEACRGLLAA